VTPRTPMNRANPPAAQTHGWVYRPAHIKKMPAPRIIPRAFAVSTTFTSFPQIRRSWGFSGDSSPMLCFSFNIFDFLILLGSLKLV